MDQKKKYQQSSCGLPMLVTVYYIQKPMLATQALNPKPETRNPIKKPWVEEPMGLRVEGFCSAASAVPRNGLGFRVYRVYRV